MQPFPHLYRVNATGVADGPIRLASGSLVEIECAAPAEFGGPGDCWSPETLLMAAVANCFILSFRAVAEASKFEWLALHCESAGTLDRDAGATRFTEVVNRVTLNIAEEAHGETAERLLRKTEEICLVSNSLNAVVRTEATVRIGR